MRFLAKFTAITLLLLLIFLISAELNALVYVLQPHVKPILQLLGVLLSVTIGYVLARIN